MKRRGYALALTLSMLSILLIVIIGMARAGDAALNAARNELRTQRAQYAAEAGVADALVKLKGDPTATSGSGSLPVIQKGHPVESYKYAIYRPGAALPAPATGAAIPASSVYILSTGTFQGLSRGVGVTVRLTGESQGLLTGAVYAATMKISGNSSTDSYDSTKGPYSAATAGTKGDITTNSTERGSIDMSGSTTIKGTINIGVGAAVSPPKGKTSGSSYTVWRDGGASSLGEAALTSKIELPPVVVPNLGASKGSVSVQGSGSRTLTPGNYAQVSLQGNSKLTLSAGTYVFDTFDQQGSSTLITNGPVKIYVRKSVQLQGNPATNTSLKPSDLVFMLADGSDVQVQGSSSVPMVLYGPKAKFQLSGNSDVFGAVVANDVQMQGSSKVHFDESLRSFSLDGASGSAAGRTVLSWQRF